MNISYIAITFACCLMSVACRSQLLECPIDIDAISKNSVNANDLAKACKKDSDSLRLLYGAAIQSNRIVLAEAAISSLEINNAISINDYQEIAYYYFEKKQWDKASDYFAKSIKYADNDNLVRLSYAIALQNNNDINGALKQYSLLRNNLRAVSRTSKIEDDRFEAHDDMNSSIKYESLVRHADLLILMKKYSEAEDLTSEAIKYFKYGGDAYYLQGKLLSNKPGCAIAHKQINTSLQKATEYGLSYLVPSSEIGCKL